MPSTYTLISSNVLTSPAASVTFSAIPSTYTDLVLRYSARSSSGFFAGWSIQFNNTSSVYSVTRLDGSGSSATSTRGDNQSQLRETLAMRGDAGTANIFATGELYIANYASSNHKVASGFSEAEDNSASGKLLATANLYRDTSAISTLTFYDPANSRTILAGSSFYLYGIKNS